MTTSQNRSLGRLRWLTVVFAVCVAAFVPLMQILFDRDWPRPTKPALLGMVLGITLCSLCLLPRRWHVRLFLMSFAGLLTLGIAEMVASLLTGASAELIYEWDDRCIYRLRPNARKVFVRTALNGGDRIPVSINSLGFRGPELQSDVHPSETKSRRMIVYGDSFVEAEYTPFEKTFAEQLRAELTSNWKSDVEVLNAGVIGYGPDQMLLRMESELPTLKPEIALVCFFADNDLGDLLRNKLFQLDDQGDLQPHAWQIAPGCGHPGRRPPYEPTLWKSMRDSIRNIQSRHSVTESYMDRWLQQCTDEYSEYVVQKDPFVRELQVDHYDADVSLTPDSASAKYKIKLFGKILERMAATCRKNSTRLFVVIIPSPADLIENYDFCAIDRLRFRQYNPKTLSNKMVGKVRELNIHYVNLFESFKTSGAEQLYFRGGDNHWNDRGQHAAADVVAGVLRDW